jgi:hypothetical protein
VICTCGLAASAPAFNNRASAMPNSFFIDYPSIRV